MGLVIKGTLDPWMFRFVTGRVAGRTMTARAKQRCYPSSRRAGRRALQGVHSESVSQCCCGAPVTSRGELRTQNAGVLTASRGVLRTQKKCVRTENLEYRDHQLTNYCVRSENPEKRAP
eukprot:204923-Pyramimonas_sp.AAC.1